MKKNRLLIILTLVLMIASSVTVYASDGSSYDYDGYTYDYWGEILDSPAAFTLERVLDSSNFGGIPAQGLNDVETSDDGRIFLTDTAGSRIFVLDADGNYITAIRTIKNTDGTLVLDENGNQMILTNPEGTFTHEKENELYIADTGAQRIIVLNLEDYTMKRIIEKPDNMTGVTEFKPSKIAVDQANRIYAVIQSSYEGIVEIGADGSFIGYYGVNVPKVNLIEYFWKTLATDAQKEKMDKTYAPAFNNIQVDSEGFVMAVTYDSAATNMVFRLNSKGENVLRQTGNTPVIGDIWSMNNEDSQFVDIAITGYGTYALLDQRRGRVFIYDFDGQLLNVFGTKGDSYGQFKQPTSIAWLGEKLVITDRSYTRAYILRPTDFGASMMEASRAYYNGEWDNATAAFEHTIELNNNYQIGYTGIGKNYLMKNDYKTAMYYFKLGNNREYYSKAYDGYRGELMSDHFGWIAAILIILLAALFVSEIRYHRKGAKKS